MAIDPRLAAGARARSRRRLLTLTVAAAHPGAGTSTPPVPTQAVDEGIAISVPGCCDCSACSDCARGPACAGRTLINAREADVPGLAEAAVLLQERYIRVRVDPRRSFSGNISMDDSGGSRIYRTSRSPAAPTA